jgi:hypothetical protein
LVSNHDAGLIIIWLWIRELQAAGKMSLFGRQVEDCIGSGSGRTSLESSKT